jgi:Lysylphosphatidylglycerol synthase TM region
VTTDPDTADGRGLRSPGVDLALNSWIGPVRLGRRAALLRRRRGLVTAVVLAVSVATCVGLSAVAGWHATSERLQHLVWPFLPTAVLAHGVAYSGYLVAHHQVLNRPASRRVSWKAGAQVVVIGFGAWLIGGGFEVDRRALVRVGLTEADAGTSVIALGALELAVLAPAAWVCALVLLASGGVTGAVTIPWVVGVPVGLTVTVAAALSQRVRRATTTPPRSRLISIPAGGLASMLALVKDPRRAPAALAGVAIYWVGDIVALWAALRFVSTTIELPRLIVGYATGYVLTRRTLPFAGALITEALLALSLLWVGVPLASAAIAVLVYRLSDFTLTFGAALCAGSAVERTLTFLSVGAGTVEAELRASSSRRAG